jgi:hypothetical protein
MADGVSRQDKQQKLESYKQKLQQMGDILKEQSIQMKEYEKEVDKRKKEGTLTDNYRREVIEFIKSHDTLGKKYNKFRKILNKLKEIYYEKYKLIGGGKNKGKTDSPVAGAGAGALMNEHDEINEEELQRVLDELDGYDEEQLTRELENEVEVEGMLDELQKDNLDDFLKERQQNEAIDKLLAELELKGGRRKRKTRKNTSNRKTKKTSKKKTKKTKSKKNKKAPKKKTKRTKR